MIWLANTFNFVYFVQSGQMESGQMDLSWSNPIWMPVWEGPTARHGEGSFDGAKTSCISWKRGLIRQWLQKYDSPLIYDPLELEIENHEDAASGDDEYLKTEA